MGQSTGTQGSPMMKPPTPAPGGFGGGAGLTPKPLGLPAQSPFSANGSPAMGGSLGNFTSSPGALPMTPAPSQGFTGGPTLSPPQPGNFGIDPHPMPMTQAPPQQPNPVPPSPGIPRRQFGGGAGGNLPFYGRQ